MKLIAVLRAAAPRKRLVLGAVLVSAAADLAALALTATAVWLIARAAERPSIAVLGVAIVGVRAFALARGVLRYGERLISHDTALRSLVRLRTQIYRALSERDASRFRDADLQGRLVADVEVVQDLLLRCLIPAFGALVTVGVTVGFCWVSLPWAGILLAVGAALAGCVVPLSAFVLAVRAARLASQARNALGEVTLDLLGGAADLAAAGADGEMLARARSTAAEVERQERGEARVVTGAFGLVVGLQGLTAAAVAYVALRGQVPAVWVPVLALTALAAFEVIKPLVVAARCLADARPMVDRLAELLSVRPVALGSSTPVRGDVWEVAGVQVRYRADSLALDGVSLRLEPGRSVALVGASGSGKSTLLALLSREVEASSGRVTLAGVDIRRFPADEVRLQISGLFQDAHVFAATVDANMRLAAPDACDELLRDAARRAGILSWIESLPEGWQTLLGDDGALMSGGQRKRLLLARALLADRPVLLLDEPTEGLDPALADEVMAAVLTSYEDRALCVATHRLTGLEAFDEIVVLDAGRVVERGTHRELLSRPGFYRALWSAERLASVL